YFFFSSRRRHTRFSRDWSSDVCSSDLREVSKVKPIVAIKGGKTEAGAKAASSHTGSLAGAAAAYTAAFAQAGVLQASTLGDFARSEGSRVGEEGRDRCEYEQEGRHLN